ncbi:unnamed protein product [Adineta steineri]|uniref:F-box domain-containing protein n=1 Tax=Adineta steineri TaxID=433720 RepID=A0A813TLK1_9BILA|nr:unnamed protein product [Adineta steineri]CAF4133093.1 unnamed protein product [Adineta steineri]
MSLELLPNEILLDIFEYFNGIDLLRAFYGLNNRFNMVLHGRFSNCSIDFHSISKYDFDTICQSHFPTMSKYISTLHLFDNEETPKQIKLFLSSISSFNQFIQLKYLSLSNIRSYSILIRILEECHHLPYLTHLNFYNCYLQDNHVDFQIIMNHIWSLSKLTYCTMGIAIQGECMLCTPAITSTSLTHLIIDRIQVELNQINRLFEFTPKLQYLSLSVRSFIDNNYQPISLPSLTDLSIHSIITCNALNMTNLLQNTPNLHRLNINLSCEIVDGTHLEQIIRNNLPELEILQLKMKMILPLGQHIQNRVDVLLNSFQSSFWIDDHQWFIRCFTSYRTIYLYSLSTKYEENLPVTFKSTYQHDDQQDFYHAVTKLISPTFFVQSIPSSIRLINLEELHLNLPIVEQFWTLVPDLNRLKTLKILLHTNAFRSQVQALLDRAPHLYRLSINQHESTNFSTSLFKYRNASIRELDLRDINHYFNEEDCFNFSHSPLGMQCEKLSILVSNRQCVVTLIKFITKLRMINVRCKDEIYIQPSISEEDNEDDCIQWLKVHSPSRCVIVRDPKLTCNILIWI